MEIQGRKVPQDILEAGYKFIPVPDGCLEGDVDYARRVLYMLGMMDERQYQHDILLATVAEKLKDRELFPESNARAKDTIYRMNMYERYIKERWHGLSFQNWLKEDEEKQKLADELLNKD